MKKFLLCIALFFGCAAAADIAFGAACRYLNSHAKGGDTATHYTITMEQTEPLVVMGSSRASHHYVSEILEDSLGMGVYNCGVDGNGILFQYGRLMLILERYKPEVIIYDAISGFDISSPDFSRDLKWLRRWYGHASIDTLLSDISKTERLKLQSNLYRFNGDFVQMLSDNIRPMQDVAYHGYRPMHGVIDYEPEAKTEIAAQWQPLKLKYFSKFIEACIDNSIRLIVVYSPWYRRQSSAAFTELSQLCGQYEIPVIDYYGEGTFNDSTQYFNDDSHLNHQGAQAFSKSLVKRLRPLLPAASD